MQRWAPILFLWIGIGDPYPFPDPDSLPDPLQIADPGSPITRYVFKCIYIYIMYI